MFEDALKVRLGKLETSGILQDILTNMAKDTALWQVLQTYMEQCTIDGIQDCIQELQDEIVVNDFLEYVVESETCGYACPDTSRREPHCVYNRDNSHIGVVPD